MAIKWTITLRIARTRVDLVHTFYLHLCAFNRCIILRCESIWFRDCCAHLNLFDFAPNRFIFHQTDCNWFIGIQFRMHFGIRSVYKSCERTVYALVRSALTITFAKSSCCRLFLLFVCFVWFFFAFSSSHSTRESFWLLFQRTANIAMQRRQTRNLSLCCK